MNGVALPVQVVVVVLVVEYRRASEATVVHVAAVALVVVARACWHRRRDSPSSQDIPVEGLPTHVCDQVVVVAAVVVVVVPVVTQRVPAHKDVVVVDSMVRVATASGVDQRDILLPHSLVGREAVSFQPV